MSKTAKIVIAVLVIAALAYGAYHWYTKNKDKAKVIPLAPADVKPTAAAA